MASSHPPPRAKPLTAATTGLPHCSSRRIMRWPAQRARLPVGGALAADLSDVGAGDERLGAGTGEEHAADGALALDPAGRVVQLRDDRGVERVELVRPVDRDRGDAVREIEEQRGIGHGGDPVKGWRRWRPGSGLKDNRGSRGRPRIIFPA